MALEAARNCTPLMVKLSLIFNISLSVCGCSMGVINVKPSCDDAKGFVLCGLSDVKMFF